MSDGFMPNMEKKIHELIQLKARIKELEENVALVLRQYDEIEKENESFMDKIDELENPEKLSELCQRLTAIGKDTGHADNFQQLAELCVLNLEESPWIDVNERLPESKGVYFTRVSNGPDAGVSWFQNRWFGHHVTHWMPIPRSPEK